MSEAVPLMAGSHELAFRLLIDGNLAEGASRIPVVNPANGAAFAECPVASAQQLDAAVAGALRAFPGWSALVPADRADVRLRKRLPMSFLPASSTSSLTPTTSATKSRRIPISP